MEAQNPFAIYKRRIGRKQAVDNLIAATRKAERLIAGTDAEFIAVDKTATVGLGEMLRSALAPFEAQP